MVTSNHRSKYLPPKGSGLDMAVRYKTVKNKFPEMKTSIKKLDGAKVNVGVLEGEHAWLAAIHEYGCRIPVTPKMRAWFHYQGVHLKESTKEIIIPERAFLRGGFDENSEKVIASAEAAVAKVIDGSMSDEKLLEFIGLQLATAIKKYAVDLREPPNSSFTTKKKGSSNPLVDTGDMINGITFEVEK